MRNNKDKKRELEKMKEMLNIDSESLKKFTFKYSSPHLGRTSSPARPRTPTSAKSNSCSRAASRRTHK